MLVKWNPYKEFERTFDDVFSRSWLTQPLWDDRRSEVATWKPAVNVFG